MKKLTYLYLGLSGLTTLHNPCTAAAAEKDSNYVGKPNIVLLLTDDQGYGDIRCYGNPDVSTPNLDKLAAEGTRFTDFYAGAAVSTASRAGLLTGRYAERVGTPGVLSDNSDKGIKPGEFTLADYLKQNNYATGMFGKWHLGCLPQYMPVRHGFTEFFGLPYSMDMWPFHPQPSHQYKPLPLYDNEQVVEYNPQVDRMTTRLTERAVSFIKNHKDEPFFLYFPYTQPHVPLGVSDKFKGKSGKGLYADVLMEIDWSVGQIMKTLKDNGLDKNTLVIFTSDNGPWLSYGNHAGTTLGLREGKGTTFEGGQRVPLIMRMPGTIPAGEVSNQFFSALDITPTLVALTGSEMPRMNPFDGENVWSIMTGKEDASHSPFFFVYNCNVEALRDGKWKCVAPHHYRIVTEPGRDGLPGKQINNGAYTGTALYDMEADPSESNNLAAQYPDIAAAMLKMIMDYQLDIDKALKTK